MGKLNVKNGTPVGNDPLCRRCSHGQYMTGYRESEVLVICGNLTPAMVVPFPVHECTDFWDRHRPDWEQMKNLALDFSDNRRRPTQGFKQTGFAHVPVVVPDEDEEDEAARLREAQVRFIR